MRLTRAKEAAATSRSSASIASTMRRATSAGSRPAGIRGAVPCSGRSASPVSVCGGRRSMTLILRGRTSRARARKPAETPAFAAEYATIPAVGISATMPLAFATNPPGSSTGIAACASRSGSVRSRATISSTTVRGVSASGPNATAPARQMTPSSRPSRSRAARTTAAGASGTRRSSSSCTTFRMLCSASRSRDRAASARTAPRDTSSSDTARPRPPVAPTTRMRAPSSSRLIPERIPGHNIDMTGWDVVFGRPRQRRPWLVLQHQLRRTTGYSRSVKKASRFRRRA